MFCAFLFTIYVYIILLSISLIPIVLILLKNKPMTKNLTLLTITLLCGICLNGQRWFGHTFFQTGNMTTSTIKMVDTASTTEKTWSVTGAAGYSTYLMPGGKICKTTKVTPTQITGGGVHGKCQIIDWAGNLVWDYTHSTATEVIHHDHCVLPNGNILLICYEPITVAECIALGRNAMANVKFEKIIEVKPTGLTTGTVVWEWKFKDHLVQTSDISKPNYTATPLNRPERFNINYSAGNLGTDFIHANGIDYNPELDQIVFSAHFLNEWYIIDHSTTTAEAATSTGGITGKGGDFLYRWGSPSNYGSITPKNFNVLHDAHWVSKNVNRAGSIVAINNIGQTSPTTKSTIDWAKPSLSGFLYPYTVGQTLPPAIYDKRLITAGYTSNMGNSEQFPNGNTMVCIATSGVLYEYDSNSNLLWTYSTGGSTAQAHRYTNCEIDTNSIRATIDTYTVFKCTADPSPVYINVNTSKGTGTNAYQWSSYPGGALPNTTASFQANPNTTTSYTVTVTSGNCTITATKMIRVVASPIANAGNDTTITLGQSATLNGNGDGTYLWSPGGQTTKSITVNPTSKTSYILKVSKGNCFSFDTVIVDVFVGPLTIKPNAKDTMVCIGDSVSLNANALGGTGIYNYTWSSIPAGFTGSNKTLKIKVNTTTQFKVVVNDGVNIDSSTINITASTKPNVFAGNDTFVISGQSVTLTASGGANYKWNTGGSNASLNVSPTCKTKYTVISSNNNCSDTDEVIVAIKPQNVNGKKVKFAVDMRNFIINPEGIHVMGDFQTDAGFAGGNWNACSIELFKESTDTNIYSRVLILPAHKKYEFKYINGMFDYEQEFVPEESRVGYNFVDNRWIYIDSLQNDTTIIGAVLFELNAPFNQKLIRFKVDMSKETSINTNKIHLGASFQGFDATKTVLYSFVPKIYEVISYVNSINHEYKFINGNTTTNAELVPTACATNTNRKIVASKDTVLPTVCFASCDTCKKTNSIENTILEEVLIAPNPVKAYTTLSFNQSVTGIYKIVNQLGEMIFTDKIQDQSNVNINRKDWNAGIYYLQIKLDDNSSKTYKLLFE